MQKSKDKKVIGVDLDDVLLDCHSALCEFHNNRYADSGAINKNSFYELEQLWNCTRETAISRVVEFYGSKEHANAIPIVGAAEAIKELSKNNSLFIVTIKPEFLREDTMKWLAKHDMDYFEDIFFTNHFCGNGVKRTKSEICEQIGAEVFIDDSLSNAADIGKNGTSVLLFDSPWNQGEVPMNTTRVLSWKEILDRLK